MKNLVILLSVAILLVAGIIVAQKKAVFSYEKQWQKVEELAEKQLPESALKELETIVKQATNEKNVQQLIKATIYKMRFTLEKEPDKAPDLIRDFETFTEKTTNKVDKALLYSMTAELYAQFYQSNQWDINNRTDVEGIVPEDIKEWTKNLFLRKISKLLLLSTNSCPYDLLEVDIQKYNILVDLQKDSREFKHTLYDFLAYRKIEILTSINSLNNNEDELNLNDLFSEYKVFDRLNFLDDSVLLSIKKQQMVTYQEILGFHAKKPNDIAFIFADLQRIVFVYQNFEIADKDSLYLAALNRLENQYKNIDFVVEILAEKADYYLDKGAGTIEKNDYKKTAFTICADGIKRFPNYKRIDLLKNIQKNITQKSLTVNHNEVLKPASNLVVNVNSANITALQIKTYRINATALEYFTFKQNRQTRNADYPNRTLLETSEMKIKADPNFEATDTSFTIKSKEYGIYEISITEKGNTDKVKVANTVFIVSDFGFIQRVNVVNLQNLYVLDRQTGLQQAGVQVSVYEPKWTGNGYKYDFKSKSVSDSEGLCKIPFNTNYYETKVFFERGKDVYFSTVSYANFHNNAPSINETPRLNIFTDRSIYRPGQTVYFKGIAYYAYKNRNEIDKFSNYELTLLDVNNQKVSSKTLKTNEFGSFSGEFVLPDGGLNGQFSIQSTYGTQFIWVEEYKRPTFEVTMEKPKTEVRFGEKITLKGIVKAYAGYNIADAKVNYRVNRNSHRYCWWWSEPETEIVTGTAVSDADGKFEVSFVPEKPKTGSDSWRGNFYTYTISADVTDPKGETQQGEQSVSLGDKSLFIIATVPDKMDKNTETKIDIYTETLNGERLNSVIDYEVYRMAELADFIDKPETKIETKNAEKVASGKFNTSDKSLQLEMKKWKSAQYKLVLKTKDAFGSEVKTENIFVLYSTDDKRPPVKSYVWLLTPKTTCTVGEKAEIQFGTSTKNTAVLYEILQGNAILESRWIKFNDEIKAFEIPFKEAYGAGVNVNFTFMKDEMFFTEQVQLTRKVIEKKLTPALTVFRNKLLPGEKAEWTITIPETVKDIKVAELLVGMYDASLDAIRPHSWSFNPVYNEGVLYSPVWSSNNFESTNDNVYFDSQQKDVTQYQFDVLNWFGLDLSGGYGGRIMMRGAKSKGIIFEEDAEIISVSENSPRDFSASVAKVSSMDNMIPPPPPPPVIKEVMGLVPLDYNSETKKNSVQVRTNFNETAFFYPQLRTDAQGNVKFTFTAPESLTRWNVKMLAHTPDLYFGQGEAQVVTQKDLMVQMNLPRFVRRSDKLILSANVINLTERELKANVTFELIDPATEKPIKLKNAAAKQIVLKANETKVVEWEVSEFSELELLICKMIAESGSFSDGEQKYLPVLPDKVLVTESMPLTIRGNQTRTFNFESLLKNGSKVDTKNLSVEFSSNPAWYAVQALPTLSAPENDNALDYFTAYYANSLAAFIANSNPKIAKVFDQWKNAKSSRDALISNLQKNAELKNMLLEETPWVMAAIDETEQKRQIALLFDLNMQKNQAQQYLDKLLKLQTSNGGFAWFEGMPESRYITQEIMLNLSRLNRLTVQQKANDKLQSAISKALNYLDLEISRDFAELKKYNKNYAKENCIENIQLFYLHTRSEFPEIPVHAAAIEAVKFYTAQSEKYWTSFTLYGKAMMAVVAHRNGKAQIANDILKSLKENALKTDELGMYWAKNTSGYFWNERPIAVQAAIIEAYAEITKNIADIDEMKIWLLKQKQTQRWDSPTATVNAIYALLLQGSDWLSNEGSVKIELGNKTLQPTSKEAGTGYFKETIPVANVRPAMGKVTVSSIGSATSSRTPNNGSIGWGAMYWQYFQEQDKIQGQSGALKVTKKLFVKQGTTMIPIEQTELKKGDKIITRLVVSTDRNLEFLALKDLRASCFEPVNQRSGCEWKESVCYYQTTKDASTQFFFSYLPKGTYVFEYELWANNSGTFTSGIASIQCQYAPEFVSHTGGEKINVK